MATVQIWNGSTWIDFYTLPNATSNTLGGVKIGNNITVSSGTISLTKNNVTSALGYTPLSLAGGTMTGTVTLPENKMAIKFRTNNSYETGFVYGTAGNEAITLAMKNPVTAFQIVYGTTPSAFTSSTWQNVTPLFQTKDNKVIINRKIAQTSDTTNLKLLDVNGDMAATTIYEGGTALSSKYQAKGSYAAANHNHDSSYLPLSGGNISGHIYLTGSNASSSTGNTSQVVFGTANNQHIVLSANDKALIINPTTSNTANQIVLYLNQQSVFPSGITSNGTINASTLQENGTYLVNKYLGKTATAADSNKLGGKDASYYAKDSEVVKTSGNQDNIDGTKIFTGTLKAKNLFVAPPDADTGPRIKVYNQVDEYYVNMPASSGTIALTSQIPTYTAGTGLSLSNGAFSVKTGYTTNGKNYKVAADNSGNLYVNVPWTDTNTDTHYINYLQIKGNNTEAVKFTQKENTSLNLKPGSNVSISATSGEITISATDTTYSAATQSAAGLMSSTDKTKLDGVATGATKVTTDTVSGWGYTKNTGTVTQVKVGTTAYNPSSGVVSLPAYPSIPTSLKNPNSITIKAGNDTVSSYDGSAAKTFTLAASTTAGAFTVSDGTTTKTIQLAGKFTDNNTWRPVVDNLTSTDTDKSLSANQGKVLKGLVDGKAASDHKHSQYLTSHLYRPIKIKDTTTVIGNTSSTALNLKEGTNISLSHDGNGGITISSTASGGGGGLTCTQVFEGAGDRSGQYHQAGSWSTKINIVSQGYKLLIFYLDVNDYKFPCCAQVPASSFTYYLRYTCSSYDGSVTVVDITYSDSEFTAEKLSGSGTLYNVDIYAYK